MQKEIVSGGQNISKVIDRSPKATYHLLETGKIAGARKVGGVWTLHVPTFIESFKANEHAA